MGILIGYFCGDYIKFGMKDTISINRNRCVLQEVSRMLEIYHKIKITCRN